jgi:hypothetical protein
MIAPVVGSGSCPACTQTVLKRAFGDSFTSQLRYSVNIAKSNEGRATIR